MDARGDHTSQQALALGAAGKGRARGSTGLTTGGAAGLTTSIRAVKAPMHSKARWTTGARGVEAEIRRLHATATAAKNAATTREITAIAKNIWARLLRPAPAVPATACGAL